MSEFWTPSEHSFGYADIVARRDAHRNVEPDRFLGSGAGVLKQDAHVRFGAERQLGDVHLTIMRHVFGCGDSFFGRSKSVVEEILA